MNTVVNDPIKQINSLLDEAYKTRIHNLKKSTQLANKALKQSREIGNAELTGHSLNRLSLFHMIMANTSRPLIWPRKPLTF